MDTTGVNELISAIPELGSRGVIAAIGCVALGILAFLIYAKMLQDDN